MLSTLRIGQNTEKGARLPKWRLNYVSYRFLNLKICLKFILGSCSQ